MISSLNALLFVVQTNVGHPMTSLNQIVNIYPAKTQCKENTWLFEVSLLFSLIHSLSLAIKQQIIKYAEIFKDFFQIT